ncbi:MAG TPA: pilus assembly protein PilM [Vicinamibacterales bacterium]|nr:pilus assembly protein PilM [Vicinamibacterales bacterium]
MSSGARTRSSFFKAPPPAVAVEIAADRVAVVSIERTGDGAVVDGYAVEPLPPGVVTPTLNGRNVQDANGAGDALRRALERSGIRGTRAVLVVPDAIARVSIVPFETVPGSAADLEQLLRWQVRKSVPFTIDAAQMSWERGAQNEFVVTLARRDVVEEYEALCTRAGLHAGIVDLATFNLINAVLASGAPPEGDWLLVHRTAGDASIGIVRGDRLIFFRNRTTPPDETVEDLVHQTAMYHEDRLGGGRFARVVVSGRSVAAAADARRAIEARFGVPVETIDPRAAAALRDRIAAGPELLEALASPVGALMREGA